MDEEEKIIAQFLLPNVIEIAKEHDNLAEPDEDTQRIMVRCIGVGFSLGKAYEKTSQQKSWRERLKEAFEIIKNDSVN